ncbi:MULTISPECIES: DUF2191 domain-containing protein [unclassified Nocardia]|uniref:DUF2191 domain-containing protein n=1 Tax=Nocardia sp. NPDC056064 TaxID=3345701 RepID=UPI0035E3B0EB
MTKRLIEIDDELLASAQDALGTSGISDTVRAALSSAVVARARAAEVEWLINGGLAEMADKEQRDDVWR